VICTEWDSIHLVVTANRLTKTSDGVLISVANPTDVDNDLILSQKPHATPCKPRSLTQHICGSDLNLEGSKANTTVLDNEGGDCGSDLNGRHATDNTGLDESTVPPSLTRITRIRFRSRVRITSGLSRLRQGRTNTLPSTDIDTGYFCYTPSSSGSRSSSISAPLRSRTDDEAGRPGWGPLGRRVSMLAKKNRMKKRFKLSKDDQPWTPPQSNKVNGSEASWDRGEATEASPLLVSHPHRGSGSRSCRRRQGGRCCCIECGLSSHKKPSPDEVDEVFSKWPSRMLNYQVLFSFRIYALAVSLRWH